jgi:hypothetical protein
MLFGVVRSFHPVGGSAPVPRRRLPVENQPGDPRAGELAEPGCDVLAAAALRIDQANDLLVEIAKGDWTVAMAIPPGAEQFCRSLPARVAFFGLADSLYRVPTAERDQRIADPSGPPLETADRPTLRQIVLEPSPAPDRHCCREQLPPLPPDIRLDVVREPPGFGVLCARI